jgi:hypothetical protein
MAIEPYLMFKGLVEKDRAIAMAVGSGVAG